MNKLLKSRFAVLFVAFFTIHLLLQVSMWAKASHDDAARMLWNILSAPLMYVFASAADGYFWLIAIFNSVVWAIVLASIVIGWLTLERKWMGSAAK